MRTRRIDKAPASGLWVVALKIFEHHPSVRHVLDVPLRLRQDQPMQVLVRTPIKQVRQERLRMADEPNFGSDETKFLPQKPHQAVALRAAGGIPVTTSRHNQTAALRRKVKQRETPSHLFGESADQEWVSKIDVVMMDHGRGVFAPNLGQQLSQSVALPQAKIERAGDDEDLVGLARRLLDNIPQ